MTTVAAQISPPRNGANVHRLPASNTKMNNTCNTVRVMSPLGFTGSLLGRRCFRRRIARRRWIDAYQLGDQDGEEQRADNSFEDRGHLPDARGGDDVAEADGGQRRETEIEQVDQFEAARVATHQESSIAGDH